mgnify:CR=1 FL=1
MRFTEEVVLFDFAGIPMVGCLDTGYAIGLTEQGAAVCARMLEEEGEIRGLLGPRDMERIWSRHIVNSAAVLDFMPRKDGRQVLDV